MIVLPASIGVIAPISGAPACPTWLSSLLHMDGANGSTTFVDQTGKAWTASGAAQISTAQSRFGGASAVFDGSSNTWVDGPTSSDFAFGLGDFTIEAWARWDNVAGNQFVWGHHSNWGLYRTGSQLLYFNGSSNYWNISSVISHSTWYHVAICRSGTSMRLFLNGSQAGGTITNSVNITGTNFRIGAQTTGVGLMRGFIDEVRISKIAHYTSNFTPPAAPFSDC